MHEGYISCWKLVPDKGVNHRFRFQTQAHIIGYSETIGIGIREVRPRPQSMLSYQKSNESVQACGMVFEIAFEMTPKSAFMIAV